MNTVIQTYARRLVVVVLALTVAGCGFSRVLADWKIDQLCKQDGGVKVFEKDVPPKAILLSDGKLDMRRLFHSRITEPYRLIDTTTTVQSGEPSVSRTETRLVRTRDQFLLGTAVSYYRPTDSLGAFSFFRSHYRCPEQDSAHALVDGVFGVEGAWR